MAYCPNPNDILYKRLTSKFGPEKATLMYASINKEVFKQWYGEGKTDSDGNPRMTKDFNFVNEDGEVIPADEFLLSEAEMQSMPVRETPLESNGASQDELLGAFQQTDAEIDEKKTTDVRGRERYMEAGTNRVIANRVTDAQDAMFRRGKTEEEVQAMNNSPRSKFLREMGTLAHSIAEGYAKAKLEGRTYSKPSGITPKAWAALKKGIDQVFDQMQEYQTRIDPNGKLQVLPEQKVFDKGKDTVGTIDLLFLFSDGSAAVFDYKFINFRTGRKGKVLDTEVSPIKEKSYDLQVKEYKRILREVYGVDRVRFSRVLPVNIQFPYSKKAPSGYKPTIKTMEMGTTPYTDPLPLANEQTDDERLNKFINILEGISDRIGRDIKKEFGNERLRDRQSRIRRAIREIRLRRNLSYVLDEIDQLRRDIRERASVADPASDDYMGNAELVDMYETLKVYADFINYSRDTMAEMRKSDPGKYMELSDRFESTFSGIKLDIETVYEKMKERVMDAAAQRDIQGIDEAQPEQQGLLSLNSLRTLSDYNDPVFRLLREYMDEVNYDVMQKIDGIVDRVQAAKNDLSEWGKRNGRKGLAIYDDLINKNTGNLVARFSQEYYARRREAIENKDVAWMKEHHVQTPEMKALFEQRKKETFATYDRLYEDRKYNQLQKEKWLRRYDLRYDSAWLHRGFRYMELKDPGRWESEQYRKIKASPELKRFYDLHIELMKEFRDMIPEKIGHNFIPNVQKDIVESLMGSGKFNLQEYAKNFLNSMEVIEGDDSLGMTDPVTGEALYRIPMLFTHKLRDKDGNEDLSQKSFDLAQNLVLFAEVAHRYRNLKDVESDIRMMEEIVAERDQIVTNRFNQPIVDPVSNEVQTAKGNANAKENFRRFVNYYLYGQRIQDKDRKVKLGGREYSANKMIRKAQSYYSLKTLSFNIISGVGGGLGALANTFMTGARAKFYTNTDIAKATKTLSGLNGKEAYQKAQAAAAFFAIEQENVNRVKAEKLSASAAKRTLTMRNMYILHRKPEEFVNSTTLLAMMENYGLDEDGTPRRLDRLPEGTKSLSELSYLDDNGKFKIDGMNDYGYRRFRGIVRKVAGKNRGNANDEDIDLAQTTLLGGLLMQFKTWLPALVQERFGSTRYDAVLDEIEEGRFKVGISELISDGMLPTVKRAVEIGMDLISFGMIRTDVDLKLAEARFQEWKSNPVNARIAEQQGLTLEDYIHMRQGQFRAFLFEVRTYALILGSLYALASIDLDDDDEADYKDVWAMRKVADIMDKVQMEIGFFFSPTEILRTVKTPIPAVNLLNDFYKMMTNTFDEGRDLIVGENNDADRANELHYFFKLIPGVKALSQWFDVLEDQTTE